MNYLPDQNVVNGAINKEHDTNKAIEEAIDGKKRSTTKETGANKMDGNDRTNEVDENVTENSEAIPDGTYFFGGGDKGAEHYRRLYHKYRLKCENLNKNN